MAQLQHALEIIEAISHAASDSSKAYKSIGSNGKGAAAAAPKSMAKARASHSNNEKRRTDQQRELAKETVDVVDTEGHGMLNADLLEWSPHVSDSRLRDILASRRTLLDDLRIRSGTTPQQFASIQARAWDVVIDAVDYARAVLAGELERLRAQNYQGQLSLSLQPAASSTSRRAQATTSNDGDVLADSDDSDNENGPLFHSDPLDLLSAATTPYHSRGVSVMEPDEDNSRAASPTLATAMAAGVVEKAAAAFDLMNQ